MSSSVFFRTWSGNNVAMWSGSVLMEARVLCLMPDFKLDRYGSRLARVRFAMETKRKSLKCYIVLAMAWLIFLLKFIRYWSSSVAVVTLLADLPLLYLEWMTLICFCMVSWTLYRHLFNPAAWLQITVNSLADFSQILKVSWEMSWSWLCQGYTNRLGYAIISTV